LCLTGGEKNGGVVGGAKMKPNNTHGGKKKNQKKKKTHPKQPQKPTQGKGLGTCGQKWEKGEKKKKKRETTLKKKVVVFRLNPVVQILFGKPPNCFMQR